MHHAWHTGKYSAWHTDCSLYWRNEHINDIVENSDQWPFPLPTHKQYRKLVGHQGYSNWGGTQTSMGMVQRMGLIPSWIYSFTVWPFFVHSFLCIQFLLFVKLPPHPIKAGFEKRMRLEVHSCKRENGKKRFTFQGYLHFNTAPSL